MKVKLSLNLDTLTVETFPILDPPGDDVMGGYVINKPTTSPCLNSEQTCDAACIA